MATPTRILVPAFAGLVVVAAAVVVGVLVPRLPAVRCLLAFQGEIPPDRADFAAAPPGYALLEDPERYGVRRAWVRSPGPGPRHPVVVFLHGVTSLGIRDGRVLRAIDAFARAGFLVVAPEVAALSDPTRRDDDEGRLQRLLAAITSGALAGADGTHVGVVAISVGGAVALRACAAHRAAGGAGPAAILTIGAPADIRRPVAAWFALPLPDAGGGESFEWQRRNAAAFARNFLARATLARRFGDRPDGTVLRLWLEASEIPTALPDGLSTGDGLDLAATLLAGPAAWQGVGRRWLQDAWDQFGSLSPADWKAELHHLAGVGVFLLHGIQDPLVPVEEARALAALLEPHTVVSVLESAMLGHTQVDAAGIGERLAHVVFMDDFFDMAR